MRALEVQLSSEELGSFLVKLNQAITQLDCEQARQLLEQAVSGFQPSSGIVD